MSQHRSIKTSRIAEAHRRGSSSGRPQYGLRTRSRLGKSFFERSAVQVARELIGKRIFRWHRGRLISATIIETEAYKGPADRASRAFGGRRTSSVRALYQDAGTVYVYLVYGLHWMLNFKAAAPSQPQAVLIRGVVQETRPNRRVIAGPGKISQFLKIDRSLYGEDATKSKKIWLEDTGIRVPLSLIEKGPRIGIDYAGPYWAAKPWRFKFNPRAAAEILEQGPTSRSGTRGRLGH